MLFKQRKAVCALFPFPGKEDIGDITKYLIIILSLHVFFLVH